MFSINLGTRSWGWMVPEPYGIKIHKNEFGTNYLEFPAEKAMHWIRYGVTVCGVFIGVMKRDEV